MPTIVISRDFFKKERAEVYRHWPSAFWRELFQNSSDVLARNIDVELTQLEGFVRVVFADNGPGMTRDTLENVYFQLGATTKGRVGTVGGFGRARVLTCFSMRHYQIFTNEYHVDGESAQYDITETTPFKGCKLIIDIDESDYNELHHALVSYLAQCQLIAKVTINGEVWDQWTYRRNITRELFNGKTAFATVHVNRNGIYLNRVMVRVDGTLMFALATRAKAQVIIEIKRGQALSILTANRDGLRDGYSQILETFLTDLATDTSATLNPRRLNSDETKYREGTIRTTRHVSMMIKSDTAMAARSVVEPSELVERLLPDIHLFDQTELASVRKAITRFHPKAWSDGGLNRRPNHPQTLMEVWRIACDWAIRTFLAITGIESITWTVGWYFASADTRSMLVTKNGVHILCLNPVNDGGEYRYATIEHAPKNDTRADLRILLASAKHEAAHLLTKMHDEQFAAMLSEIDERLDSDTVLRAMAAGMDVMRASDDKAGNTQGLIWYIRENESRSIETLGQLEPAEQVFLPNGTNLSSPLKIGEQFFWLHGVVVAGQIVCVDDGRVFTNVSAFHMGHVRQRIDEGVLEPQLEATKSRANRVRYRLIETNGALMIDTEWDRVQNKREAWDRALNRREAPRVK